MNLGKLNQFDAERFVLENESASLGSYSSDGLRRVRGNVALVDAFVRAGGILAGQTIVYSFNEECPTCGSAEQITEPVGTVLSEMIANFATIKTNEDDECDCAKLAAKMDAWGIAGCEGEHREEILQQLVKNRHLLAESLKADGGWMAEIKAASVDSLPEAVVRKGASMLLSRAIAKVRSKKKTVKKQ